MPLAIDYTFMISPPVAIGIAERELDDARPELSAAIARVAARRDAGQLGFLNLPTDVAMLRDCQALALEYARDADDVVVLGIGGSALGTIALRSALLPSMWNLLDGRARNFRPRLHVLDNIDPRSIAALLSIMKPARTLFVVISKSGSTAETMAQYLIVRAHMDKALGSAAGKRFVFVTDPASGALRAAARAEGIAALEVPANVGGRFSVLSAVGVFPALLVGIDVPALLRGAAAMISRCPLGDAPDPNAAFRRNYETNPAALYAMLQWLCDRRRGARIHVFMPYSDALREMADWFVQLWAESLGKVAANGEYSGPTPVAAVGATDQHSQVQLFMEGPLDKTVTFIAEQTRAIDQTIPAGGSGMQELNYLGGHKLGELMDVERRATAGALAARGRPSMTIEMPVVDEHHLGELIMLLQIATVIAGELYGVEPLNQPGVELGKQFTYALLGKPGSEEDLAVWESLPRPDPKRRV